MIGNISKYNIDLSFFDEVNNKWLAQNTIFLCVHGSHAYGCSTPESDIDIRGIVVPPKEYFLSPLKNFEQQNFKKNDITIFGIKKFVSLALQNNPNVLELLFLDPEEHIYINEYMQPFLDNKDLFLSKKIRYSMEGYAHSQLNRINLHRRWLLNPPDHQPTRKEFDLPDHTIVPRDQLAAVDALIKKTIDKWNIGFEDLEPAHVIRIQTDVNELMLDIVGASIFLNNETLWKHAAASLGIDSNFIELVEKEKRYKSKKIEWDQYQDWKKTRNPARAALEEKYGYDCKHASHLFRLYLQCEEVLEKKTLTVKSPYRQEILDVKNGGWTYDRLMQFVEAKKEKIENLYKESKLRYTPENDKIEKIYMNVIENCLFRQENTCGGSLI